MIGKTLGHYQISSQLGKGGMGEVYQAKDQVLGRDVAVKILPDEFARDADRVARFQREAKLLASLNHPNIATIHGLEESGGKQFLVMELVEGETLADRIKAGPIPVEESLKLALQIAEALEAAHEKGVIHRDLKPANIKVTPEGKVKVLDFGLAKAFAGEQENLNLSNSPTLSNAATQQGVILGTAAYMSPEQARGKPVDKRTDIWAFGCVLFEMLSGRVAFRGEDVSEILASVIKGDVKLDLLPANLHSRVHEVIIRCLQRDLNKRYQDIRDARYEIEHTLADPGGVFAHTTAEPQRKLRTILPWAAATLVLGLIVAGVAVLKLKPTEPRQVMRFDYELPEDQQFSDSNASVIAVSPDGRQFVYSTAKGLYLRSVEEWTAKLIPGTEGSPSQPFFSPDGKWIGYHSLADQKLKKIAFNGGTPVPLCDADGMLGASWGADDTIVYGAFPGGIMRVSASGGNPKEIVKSKPGPLALGFPQILPDGKSVVYTQVVSTTQFKIIVQSLESGEAKELFAGIQARYVPTGHMVYSAQTSIFAVPFDADKLEVTGGAVPVIQGIKRFFFPQYAVSDSGTLVYLPDPKAGTIMVWVDKSGKEEPLAAPPNFYFFPRISPDGTRVALTVPTPDDIMNADVWVWDLRRRNLVRLTYDPPNAAPFWTPDGKRIVYTSQRENRLYWKAADGTGKAEPLMDATDRSRALLAPYTWAWAGNGKTLVLENFASADIGMMSMDGDRKWKSLLREKYAERQPHVSPDGRWIAYMSNESGKNEIYVRPFPEVDGGRWQVSTSGGDSPLWSPDGRELFYRNGDAVMSVPVRTDSSFSVETPKILFRGEYFSDDSVVGTTWDISPDGERFLMTKWSAHEVGAWKVNVVINWFEELKQRVPVK